ncbi:MAG: thioredoxin [Candidatus Omnitrophica bacterium]|nr:thioredoxin [Candidatus Omnitrophota bacterium]
MDILILNDDNFESEVLKSNQIILVDFWAPWCAPCRIIAPIVEEIAKEYKDKIKVAKLNVEDYPSIASRFGIMSIPTLIIFKDGKAVESLIGVVSKNQIISRIKNYV